MIPASNRGPVYCATIASFPMSRMILRRWVSTGNSSIFDRMAAVSAWPTADSHPSWIRSFLACSMFVFSHRTVALQFSMLREKALSKYIGFSLVGWVLR